MHKICLLILGLLTLAFGMTMPAAAQTDVTFLSTSGSDSNNCSRAAPCVSFNGVLPKTLAGGRIEVLNTGIYGFGNFTKSVTVAAAGGQPIFPAFGAAIALTINAPGKTVILDGFTILKAVSLGVDIPAARQVELRNCLIRGTNFSSNSGSVSVRTSENTNVFISDCTFTDSSPAVSVRSNGKVARAFLDRVTLFRSGVLVDGAQASVRFNDSVAGFVSPETTLLNGGRIESLGNNAMNTVANTVLPLR